jgi:ABC-type sugar transport system ATPase subunit
MIKILTGVHRPDSGKIELDGAETHSMRPRRGAHTGVFCVFQEILVVPARSVLDNIWLGADDLLRARVGAREKVERASEVLGRLMVSPPDLGAAVEDLSLSDRQACVIARALVRDPKILILDEATSALDVETRDRLFGIVLELSRKGAGVVLITHRMDEIETLGDRITVMRSGETVGTLARGEWTPEEVVRLMSGEDQVTGHARAEAGSAAGRHGPVVLRAAAVHLQPDRQPVDVEIRAGELVGLAGLEGHGQDAFIKVLSGRAAAKGEVLCAGASGELEAVRSPHQAARHGIAYVPRERGDESIFPWMAILDNFGIATLSKDSKFGLLSPRRTRKRLQDYRERLAIKMGWDGSAITTLSGGNQQKVVVARWLAAEPKVLLLNDPTRGVDVNAKRDLYRLLTGLAEEGLAVVMVSTEVDEHIELMDRVLVFRESELFAEFSRKSLQRETLVGSFFGSTAMNPS